MDQGKVLIEEPLTRDTIPYLVVWEEGDERHPIVDQCQTYIERSPRWLILQGSKEKK